jgi:hypothetical protein
MEVEKMKTRKTIVTFLAALLLAPMTASAMTVQVDYSLEIYQTFGGFPAPAFITGRATYDTETPLSFGLLPLLSHDITFNGAAHSAVLEGPGALSHTILFQDQVPYAQPVDRVSLHSHFAFDLFPGLTVNYIGFTLEGPDTLLSGNEPVDVNPADYTLLQDGFVTFSNGEQCPLCAVHGKVTGVSFKPVSVPEPGAFALMAGGVFSLFLTRRRRIG